MFCISETVIFQNGKPVETDIVKEIEGRKLQLYCGRDNTRLFGKWAPFGNGTRFGDQGFNGTNELIFPKLQKSNAGKYNCTWTVKSFTIPRQTVEINVLCKYIYMDICSSSLDRNNIPGNWLAQIRFVLSRPDRKKSNLA